MNTPPFKLGFNASMTKVEFELILDADIYFVFEKGMESGAFYSSKRYSQANDKYLKSYNPKKNHNMLYT